jgi:hypothetical protein
MTRKTKIPVQFKKEWWSLLGKIHAVKAGDVLGVPEFGHRGCHGPARREHPEYERAQSTAGRPASARTLRSPRAGFNAVPDLRTAVGATHCCRSSHSYLQLASASNIAFTFDVEGLAHANVTIGKLGMKSIESARRD